MGLFHRESKDEGAFLIVGLGNPGKKYERTRHNVGFMALDAIADAFGARVIRSRFDGLTGECSLDGKKLILLKPQTFMNLSGVSVEKAANYFHIPPERVLVFCDDISFPPSRMRIRRKGTHGGHNGLRNIIDRLESENFPRVKLGVGEKPRPEYDLADWVLSAFTEKEMADLKTALDVCPEIVKLVVAGKIEEAMSRYNRS